MRRLLVNLLVALNATQFADVTLLDKSCDSSFSKINLIDKKIKSISLIFDNFFHDQTIFIKDYELYTIVQTTLNTVSGHHWLNSCNLSTMLPDSF